MSSHVVHIAGVLVHARPEAVEAAMSAMREHEGVEIHDTGIPGKFVAVLECEHEREIGRCIERVQAVQGVVSVSMTSHFIEEAAALAAPL